LVAALPPWAGGTVVLVDEDDEMTLRAPSTGDPLVSSSEPVPADAEAPGPEVPPDAVGREGVPDDDSTAVAP
jgi:hypothetical protein